MSAPLAYVIGAALGVALIAPIVLVEWLDRRAGRWGR